MIQNNTTLPIDTTQDNISGLKERLVAAQRGVWVKAIDVSPFYPEISRLYSIERANEDHTSYYPSVTTVTGWDKRSFFNDWAKDPSNKKKRDRAAERGDFLHKSIELFLRCGPDSDEWKTTEIQKNIDFYNVFRSMMPELRKITNIVVQEYSMFSDIFRIAGTVDCIACYDGIPAIIDFKGSDRIKKSSWIANYFQQATAYSLMVQYLTGYEINDIVILIGTEEGITQVVREKVDNHISGLISSIKSFYTSPTVVSMFKDIRQNGRLLYHHDTRINK